jgi:iron complex outermembrane receptor protein
MLFTKKPLMAVAIIALASGGQAQTNPDLQPVTVYGSRFKETIENALPQTTIITATEIEKSGLSNVSEILDKIGNINIRKDLNGSSNSTIDLRGYGDTASNNVVVLLNGVRLSENEQTVARTSIIPVESIDHIEVHKGGSSVLFGDGATSGYINIVTKTLSDLSVVSGGIGSYQNYQSNFFTSKKISDVAINVFGQTSVSDGYRNGSNGNSRGVGGVLEWQPNTHTKAGVRLFTDSQNNYQPGALPLSWQHSSPRSKQQSDYFSHTDYEGFNSTIYTSTKVDDLEYAVDLNFREKETRWAYSKDKSILVDMMSGCPSSCWYTTSQSFGDIASKSQTSSISPRVKKTNFLTQGNDLTIGIDFSEWKIHRNSIADADTGSSITNDKQRNRSFYMRSDYKIDTSNRITGGYRKEKLNQIHGYKYYSTDYLATAKDTVNAYEIQYTRKLPSNISTFVKIGNSYRLPNTDDNHSMIYGNSYILNAQTSQDKEIGLSLMSNESITSVKMFHSDISNEIYFSGGMNSNLDKTERMGIEFSNQLKVTPNYSLRSSAQLLKAQFKSGTNDGKDIPSIPNINGRIGITYATSLYESVDFSAKYTGKSYMAEDNANTQKKSASATTFDLRYNIKSSSWSWIFAVNNLFDKNYFDYAVYKASYLEPYKQTVYPSYGRNISAVGRYVF